jgi:hypothetical protein
MALSSNQKAVATLQAKAKNLLKRGDLPADVRKALLAIRETNPHVTDYTGDKVGQYRDVVRLAEQWIKTYGS